MKDAWLDRLKLKDYLTVELAVTKSDFVNKLKQIVDPGTVGGMFADTFDVFSSSKKVYKGEVSSAGFLIKKRRRFFDFNSIGARAEGKYGHSDKGLRVDVTVHGFESSFTLYYIGITIFYTLFLGVGVFSVVSSSGFPFFVFPFILLHASFMYGLPYFMMKRAVANTKRELEREFYFLTRE